MSISYFWSESFLTNRRFLWLLFICNFVGTIYGYMWYGNQLAYTLAHYPAWLLVFVPDSPTASLFFSLAVLCLLYPPVSALGKGYRVIVEALAVVTSVKYGVWATAIIFAGQAQGDVLVWQDWMLVASHTAMAVESLLYVRFFKFKGLALLIAGVWTLLNDTLDYSYGIFPWLPSVLMDDVTWVCVFTVLLTLLSIAAAWLGIRSRKEQPS